MWLACTFMATSVSFTSAYTVVLPLMVYGNSVLLVANRYFNHAHALWRWDIHKFDCLAILGDVAFRKPPQYGFMPV